MNIRVAIAFDNFGPYHVARLAGAARHMDVLAVETASTSGQYGWDSPDLPSGLDRAILFDNEGDISRAGLAGAIDRKLSPFSPDAVAIPGWSTATSLAIARWAAAGGVPVIAMSESNAWDFGRSSATEFLKRLITEYFTAGLCTSDGQAEYLRRLGVASGAVFRGYNAVDNGYFARESALAKGAPMPVGDHGPLAEAARGRYFLASCRFVAKKNLARMLEAYGRFREGRGDDPADWPLVLLGDGDLRPELEAQRAAPGLSAHVHMPGFRQYHELPAYYGSAGCFVHASTTEQWGLVVNEAMAAGLPVIVSDRCGCAPVLVREGVNGYGFAPDDVDALAAAMRAIAAQSDDTAMRDASRALVADWGPDRFGQGMADAVRYGMTARPARPSLVARAAMRLVSARLALR